ncbi:glycosyltransferase [Shewanella sp. 10N.286.48.B5]|uniref:glycosyltransferase n=1 Tax=Shewanella sp. 10N.286.48.B5 TaxID=1880834 RepID=UPI000C855192|nr:glycosyltransferase [Shewanella sp. 10N.286.48.B5]PMH89121.1 hypothetical protein BCU57_18875 [Shewanella sp. 10N.286.48.B5]
MKILIIEPYPNYHFRSIFNEFDKDNYSIEMVCFKKVPSFRKGSDWEDSSRHKPISFFKSLLSILNNDVTVFLGVFSPLPKMMILFSLACILKKRVFIASEGFKNNSRFRKLFSPLFRCLSIFTEVNILCIGHNSNKDYFNAGFKRSNFYKFAFAENYLPYPTEEFVRGLAKFNSTDFNVLLVGRLISRKNFAQVIASCNEIAKKRGVHRNITIHVAGEGEDLELLKREAEKEPKVELILHGHIDSSGLTTLYKKAHLFVLPSLYEGWGVVLNNAIHYCLPCLCLDSVRSGNDFLIAQNQNGRIVSKDELTNALYDFVTMGSEELQLMAKASREVSKLWSAECIAFNLANLLSDNTFIPPEVGPLSRYSLQEYKSEECN